MKLDRRIVQAIEEYNAKEIKLKKKTYDLLEKKTKDFIKSSGIKVSFNNTTKGFKAIFQKKEVLMTKEILDEIENINKELQSLKKRLKRIEDKENTVIQDSVQGSSKSYPYIKHSIQIVGVEVPKNRHLKHKYRKMIRNKTYKLEKLKVQLEYELNYVKDSEIREIIRYKYNDNMTWLQVMFRMGYSSESTAKMKLKRFFEKNKKCDKCDDLKQ